MIPNYAAKMRCNIELRPKAKFSHSTDEYQRAFHSLEDERTCEPNTLDKEVTLTTDAFEKENIGDVLPQKDHPVIYISRSSTTVERKYSNNEQERLL